MHADHGPQVGDIEKERWEALLASDQLRTEMGARRAFLGFNEAPIAFAPTFKVSRRAHACMPACPRWRGP